MVLIGVALLGGGGAPLFGGPACVTALPASATTTPAVQRPSVTVTPDEHTTDDGDEVVDIGKVLRHQDNRRYLHEGGPLGQTLRRDAMAAGAGTEVTSGATADTSAIAAPQPPAAAARELQAPIPVHLEWVVPGDIPEQGGTTSVRFAYVLATFDEPVVGVSTGHWYIFGIWPDDVGQIEELSPTQYGLNVTLGQRARVEIRVNINFNLEPRRNDVSNMLAVTYVPTVLIEWGGGLVQDGFTNLNFLPVNVTFSSEVAGVDAAGRDMRVTGAWPGSMVRVGPVPTGIRWIGTVITGLDEFLSLSIPGDGVIPPARPSNTLRMQFSPTATLTWLDGLPNNGTTQKRVVTVVATFNVAVVNVAILDFDIQGGIPYNFQIMSGLERSHVFHMDLDIGAVDYVAVRLRERSRVIYPPNMESNLLELVYNNEVTFELRMLTTSNPVYHAEPWTIDTETALSVPMERFETTSYTLMYLDVRLGRPVSGFNWETDVDLGDGAWRVGNVTQFSDMHFGALLQIGRKENVTLQVHKHAPMQYPPNARAIPFMFTYAPAVWLSWSDGLVSGDATALLSVYAYMTFNTAVTGVAAEDFVVTGADDIGNFTAISSTVYRVQLRLGNSTFVAEDNRAISVSLVPRSGSITPPNAPTDTILLTYIPPIQQRHDMVRLKMRFWLDHRLYEDPFGPGRANMSRGLLGEMDTLLGNMTFLAGPNAGTSRLSIYEIEPPREGQTAVLVRIQVLPAFHRHMRKSPVAIAKEMRSFLDRGYRGTYFLDGEFLGSVDSSYMLFDQFTKCPEGTPNGVVWIFPLEEVCPPIPALPCGNATLVKQCAPYLSDYTGMYIGVLLFLPVGLVFLVMSLWLKFREARLRYLATMGMAVFTWVLDWVMIGWYLMMGFSTQAWLLSVMVGISTAVNYLMILFNHHLRWLPRASPQFDGRYNLWMEEFSYAYYGVFFLCGIHTSFLRLLYSDLLDLDEFGIQPHCGRKKMEATVWPMCVVSSLMQDWLHPIMCLWTIDAFMPDGADLILYIHFIMPLLDAWIMFINVLSPFVKPCMRKCRKAPGEMYRVYSSRRLNAVMPEGPPPEPFSDLPFTTVTFLPKKPLGLPLAHGVNEYFPAMVKGEPTDQAAKAGVRAGDCIWRINGSAIVPCTFKDVVDALRHTERPYTVDFRQAGVMGHKHPRRAPLPPAAAVGMQAVRDEYELELMQRELDTAATASAAVDPSK